MINSRRSVAVLSRRPTNWPPDDTEESVLGTSLHQGTITNLRVGLNEVASALAPGDGTVPWQALSQTIIKGQLIVAISTRRGQDRRRVH